MTNSHTEIRIPCKWCETPTTMLGTKECDFCYELRNLIERANRDVLIKMLDELRENDVIKEIIMDRC